MVDIQLLGITMDSQIVMMVIGVIGLAIAFLNYHKKSADIIIHNTDKKYEETNKSKKIEDIPQLINLHQPLNEIPKISQETLKKIYNTFPLKTKKYDNRYMFFETIEEFEISPKFISVNNSPFKDGSKTKAIENARNNLYETPTGQFVLISDSAWKDMGYDFPQIIS